MKNAKQTTSIAIRLAALMDRERIESLPRNYELLYDVYSGTNPDLTRDFMAIGAVKSQEALDEIGRKYLPHQHEEGVLAKANNVMLGQMSEFLQLIQNEMSSLAEFEKVIGEASRAISSDTGFDRAAIAKSIDKLSKATEQQVKNNKSLGDAAAAQNQAINELKKEMDEIEAQKWIDPLTGLSNRRAFNKTMVNIYAIPDRPSPCGLVFGEFDDFKNYSTGGEFAFTNTSMREVAKLFKSANASKQFMSYLDKGRFAIVLNTTEPMQIVAFVDALRTAMRGRRQMVTKRDSRAEEITLSYGIAMAADAGSARELIDHAEKALADSFASGRNKVTVFTDEERSDSRKSWMIYERT